MKQIFSSLLLLAMIALAGCSSNRWMITDFTTSKIVIDSTTNHLASKEMNDFITPYKQQLDKEMNVVIAHSNCYMTLDRPESLLSNWNADVLRECAADYLKEPVDMAVVNVGGLRAPIPKGDVTVRNIFELLPFENELVIVWLKGKDIIDLLNIFAKEEGQGVSGVRFDIVNKTAQNYTINGKPIVEDKVYSIATNDFLAAGNDRMIPMTKNVKRVNTSLRLRDTVMAYVIKQTREGKALDTKLDGRIRIVK